MNINIAQLERHLPDGRVITSHWTADKTDGDYGAGAYGSIQLPPKDPSDPSFVPYENITEELAVQWTEEALGQEYLAALQANLDRQIAELKNPTKASGVPWVHVPTEPTESEPVQLELNFDEEPQVA